MDAFSYGVFDVLVKEARKRSSARHSAAMLAGLGTGGLAALGAHYAAPKGAKGLAALGAGTVAGLGTYGATRATLGAGRAIYGHGRNIADRLRDRDDS